jgi:hypothetical protein
LVAREPVHLGADSKACWQSIPPPKSGHKKLVAAPPAADAVADDSYLKRLEQLTAQGRLPR